MLLNQIFTGIFSTSETVSITFVEFTLCMVTALALGFAISAMYLLQNKHTKSFVVTLATLPAIVSMVILMVNGNIGAGVAVAGAFSLIRFRSVPGTAKEIGAIFLAMGAGLAIGMGYLGFAVLFTVLVSIINFGLTASKFGDTSKTARTLIITLPEDLDYNDIFTDILENFTTEYTLNRVKTTNMGSLLKLTYEINLREPSQEKQFIDQIRCRNGNLEVVIAKIGAASTEL